MHSRSLGLGIAAPRATTNAGQPPRLAPQGQCPNGGGDARRRRKTERGSFSASLLSRKAPRSVLGGVSRPRRPRPRGKSVRNAKHTSTADEHTLKGDRPAEREDKQGTVEEHSMQRARLGGVGSPKGNRWRNADARPNAPAPRISPSPQASPKGALAGVQRTIQPTLGTTLALAPRRG